MPLFIPQKSAEHYPEQLELVRQGVSHHQHGDLDAAERLYLQVLTDLPEHAVALHMLGILRLEQGLHEEAVDLMRRSVNSDAENPAVWVNLAVAEQRIGQFEQALVEIERALELKPDYPNALVNQGNIFQDLERFDQAMDCYARALALEPQHFGALFNRANCLRGMGRQPEALAEYSQVLALRPNFPEAALNQGITLLNLQRYEDALASFAIAIKAQAGYTKAFVNRAAAELALGRFEDALVSANQALVLLPESQDALTNKAFALDALGRDREAIDVFRELIALDPDSAYVPGNLFRAQLRACQWDSLGVQMEAMNAAVLRGKKALVPFVQLLNTDSARLQQQCARIYAADRFPATTAPKTLKRPRSHGKIRLAYLSADFREHALSYLMAGLFELHDRERFEIIAISFSPNGKSAMGERLRSAFDRFENVFHMSDDAVAELMLQLEVDIAVDLMGFTQHSRTGIFARRPAPIQVNYLGYPGTMGAEYIDYIIADEFVIPREMQQWYTEKVVYLPDTFQVTDHRNRKPGKAFTRSEAGLPKSGFVFCSFNSNYKINPTTFDVWMNLLKLVPNSVLWLVTSSSYAEENLRREAANRGVESDSLVFAPELDYDDHLSRIHLGDLFLDALPYNAGATASDALWAGVPVLTCTGEAFASRMAGSVLNSIGLPELITQNLDDYQSMALKLANNRDLLSTIRSKLARNRLEFPLFDTDRFRRHIEDAYIAMIEKGRR